QTAYWISHTTKPCITTCFRMFTNGPGRFAPSESQRAAIRFAFPRTSKDKRTSCSMSCERLTICGASTPKRSHARPPISWQNLNAIHAFREGNGRSQLTFFAVLAEDAGYPPNIDKMDPDEMLAAMIAS